MASTSSQCAALNISDEKRCEDAATSVNGLFCAFHSKQCQGLYRGYKRRNAQLDKLSASPPQYLVDEKPPISFDDLNSQETCQEIHDYLFLKLQLIERVIRARKLHHSRFFSMNYDYGHAKFLDQLQGERATAVRALERIERRAAEILYQNQKWYTWVRECQEDEEAHREKEQKKLKQEAALFKRHWKEYQQRIKETRVKEDRRKQDAFLEKVYKERLSQQETEQEDGLDWDPIEDVLEDKRGSFIDLIKHFLWMVEPEDVANRDTKENSSEAHSSLDVNCSNSSVDCPGTAIGTKSSSSNGDGKIPLPKATKVSQKKKTGKHATNAEPFDKGLIETRDEMHNRLKNGSDYKNDNVVGLMIAGTIENPVIETKTITFPEDEIQRLLREISEIKHLLFCRLLIGYAALLPAALRADSVEAFLADEEVPEAGLRDICLKMERPGLQEIRDACADFFRSADEDPVDSDFDVEIDKDDGVKTVRDTMFFKPPQPEGALPEKWISPREKALKKLESTYSRENVLGGTEGTVVDFGSVNDDGKFQRKKIRVKICGRTIWNYPSDRAMNRGGWLHFCIIAKDTSLHDAIALCRHWDEFFELNILAVWHYFPATNWASWVGNRGRQQLLQLGFIMYFETSQPDAEGLTIKTQTGPARRGQSRRSHAVFEARNFICAHIKRNDQVSRRFIQYLSMQTHRLLVLVRDAETGRFLITPPEEEQWLWRQKVGLGRATKNEWNVMKRIGPKFFEEMDHYRQWHFGFKEHYDIYIWDVQAGEPFPSLFNAIQDTLFKAHRCCSGADLYSPSAAILKTLYREKESHWVRDLKPGDNEHSSIYDEFHGEDVQFFYSSMEENGVTSKRRTQEANVFPRYLFYNEADALEDEILFPEEMSLDGADPLAVGKLEPLRAWEKEGFSVRKFVEGWDSDSDDSFSDELDEDDDGSSEDEDSTGEDEDGDNLGEDEDGGSSGEDEDITSEDEDSETYAKILDSMFPPEIADIMKQLRAKRIADGKEGEHTEDLEERFMTFLDKEKAKIFKDVWHKGDLDPQSKTKYVEMMEMTKASRSFNQRGFEHPAALLSFQLLLWLDCDREDSKDVHKVVAKLEPFFDLEFLKSEKGEKFKDSLLFNQEERAKHLPDHRSHVSISGRPKEFWDVWDGVKKTMTSFDDIPAEWDRTIRPIIARLYKAGVIRNKTGDIFAGQAIAAQEPHRDPWDFFIDWRHITHEKQMTTKMNNPHSVTPFRTTAHVFSAQHPNARFAILRLWSAPHFYPLMVGEENREGLSFRDLVGRVFVWMFVPKDMPDSEWSIHLSASQRLRPFTKQFGGRVVAKRDAFLVMGTDEKDLKKLAMATAYAIERKPWRWEVDLWKSFVNVDIEFLDRLDGRWFE